MKKCRFFQVGLCSFLIFLLSAFHVSACSVELIELGDFVWNDLNRDGIQDASEPGIDGIAVSLFDGNNNQLGSTITNSAGWYKFTGLQYNTYLVEFLAPAGFDFTVAKIGADPNIDSDVTDINLFIGRTDPIVITVDGDYDWVADAGMSQVPVPAAVWLLGSGLIGLVGLRRSLKARQIYLSPIHPRLLSKSRLALLTLLFLCPIF